MTSWMWRFKSSYESDRWLWQHILIILKMGEAGINYRLLLLSHVRLWTLGTAAHQASLTFTNSRVCSSLCPLSQWCHPTISSSVIPFSCLQSFPASGFFSNESGGQSIGGSVLASVLPMNNQSWFLLGLIDGSPCSPRHSRESSPTP